MLSASMYNVAQAAAAALKGLGCARSLIAIMADACMKVNQVCALHMATVTLPLPYPLYIVRRRAARTCCLRIRYPLGLGNRECDRVPYRNQASIFCVAEPTEQMIVDATISAQSERPRCGCAAQKQGERFLAGRAELVDELETAAPAWLRRRHAAAWNPAWVHFLKVSATNSYRHDRTQCPQLSSAQLCSIVLSRCMPTVLQRQCAIFACQANELSWPWRLSSRLTRAARTR